jgi:hypothetical protein
VSSHDIIPKKERDVAKLSAGKEGLKVIGKKVTACFAGVPLATLSLVLLPIDLPGGRASTSKGVKPELSNISTGAPRSIKILITSMWPSAEAKWSAVFPSWFVSLKLTMSQELAKRYLAL